MEIINVSLKHCFIIAVFFHLFSEEFVKETVYTIEPPTLSVNNVNVKLIILFTLLFVFGMNQVTTFFPLSLRCHFISDICCDEYLVSVGSPGGSLLSEQYVFMILSA